VSAAGDASGNPVPGDVVDVRDVDPVRTVEPRVGALRRVLDRLLRRRATAGGGIVAVEAAARTDRFDDFYRMNYAPVVRLAMSLCGSAVESEELAARAFLAAHRRWRRIVALDRPDRWIRRVVVNRAVTYGEPNDDLAALPPAPEVASAAIQLLEFEPSDPELWAALRDLAPRHAQVLALAYVDDQPTDEIAAILGLDPQRVRALLDTARNRLARLLAEQHPDGRRR
jgi:RNA polymerase sigma-70 factor (ECF subfamily)